jgi:RNA polymerase sigma-70 factor (ECF subfamily)
MENVITNEYELQPEEVLETALINGAIVSNKQKFIELITMYKPYLYRTAYAYVKDEYKAKEILQECTFKAFLNVKKLKNPVYFKTWITKILINAAIDTLRKDSRTEYLEDNNALTSPIEGSSLEEKIDLYNAIDLLKPNYKTVIILKYFNDLSVENIAAIMEVPQNTVKTYLRRAKENLAKILKEDYLNE